MATLPQIPWEPTLRKTGEIINAPENISHTEHQHLQREENLEKKPQQKENLGLAPTNAEACKSTTKHNPPLVFGEQLFMQSCYLGTEKSPFLKPQLSFSLLAQLCAP